MEASHSIRKHEAQHDANGNIARYNMVSQSDVFFQRNVVFMYASLGSQEKCLSNVCIADRRHTTEKLFPKKILNIFKLCFDSLLFRSRRFAPLQNLEDLENSLGHVFLGAFQHMHKFFGIVVIHKHICYSTCKIRLSFVDLFLQFFSNH